MSANPGAGANVIQLYSRRIVAFNASCRFRDTRVVDSAPRGSRILLMWFSRPDPRLYPFDSPNGPGYDGFEEWGRQPGLPAAAIPADTADFTPPRPVRTSASGSPCQETRSG
jgi:hypothetical protein